MKAASKSRTEFWPRITPVHGYTLLVPMNEKVLNKSTNEYNKTG